MSGLRWNFFEFLETITVLVSFSILWNGHAYSPFHYPKPWVPNLFFSLRSSPSPNNVCGPHILIVGKQSLTKSHKIYLGFNFLCFCSTSQKDNGFRNFNSETRTAIACFRIMQNLISDIIFFPFQSNFSIILETCAFELTACWVKLIYLLLKYLNVLSFQADNIAKRFQNGARLVIFKFSVTFGIYLYLYLLHKIFRKFLKK